MNFFPEVLAYNTVFYHFTYSSSKECLCCTAQFPCACVFWLEVWSSLSSRMMLASMPVKNHHHHHHLIGIIIITFITISSSSSSHRNTSSQKVGRNGLQSVLLLALVVQSAELLPGHFSMLSAHLCRCWPLVLFSSILPLSRVFSIILCLLSWLSQSITKKNTLWKIHPEYYVWNNSVALAYIRKTRIHARVYWQTCSVGAA